MPRKPTRQDDPAESKRFIEMARQLEADESPEAFDRAFGKADWSKKPTAPLRAGTTKDNKKSRSSTKARS